jgi:SAM-dependent methyltransferase
MIRYRHTSQLYDLDPRPIVKDDLPFYLDRARRSGGPVLELGAGTGRVAIPIARAGIEVLALDRDPAMLEVFREKLAKIEPADRARVRIVEGDMAELSLGEKFPLITAPFRAFQALTDPEARRRCLRGVREHLTADGRFVVHVFRPQTRLDETWVRPETVDFVVTDPRTGRRVERLQRRRAIDPVQQVIEVELAYRVEGEAEEISDVLRLAYFYEDDLRGLLTEAGLAIEEAMGGFDGSPIQSGKELIFVARR